MLDWKRVLVRTRLAARLRLIRRKLSAISLLRFLGRVTENMGNDGATELVGSISYYVFLSLFPLLLGIIALLGLFLPQAGVKQAIMDFAGTQMPGLEDFFRNNIEGVIQARGTLGIISIMGLVWSGSGMFGAIHLVVNRAFGIRRRTHYVIRKAREVTMAVSASVFFLLSMGATALISFYSPISSSLARGITFAAAFILIFFVFLLIYKMMPDTRTYWRDALLGAGVSTILFEIARVISTIYFTHIAKYQLVYGSIASVIVLLLWIFLSATILVLGAEVSSEYSIMRRGLKPRHLQHSGQAARNKPAA